jgi:hypothetical protein
MRIRGLAFVGFGLIASGAALAQGVTFTKDVLPILQERCIQCHRHGGDNISGMIAPMSMTSYEETRPWAKAIAKTVASRRMPPWFASDEYDGLFKNERKLTEAEIETITTWVEQGARRGNPADAPAPVEFANTGGWLTGVPDLIVEMPEPYFVKDDVEDLYVTFMTEPLSEEQLPHDRWLRSIEWRGGSEVVHHIVGAAVIQHEDGDSERFDLGSIAPGEEGMRFEQGYGKLLPKGSRIVFAMHYHKETGPGTGMWDRSSVSFRFWDEEKDPPIKHMVQRNGIINASFEIPPGHGYWEVGAAKVFDVETQILSLHPHMHLRGKDAKYVAYYPNGTHEVLLEVPNFDFNWQLDYDYRHPKTVPAGTRVEYTAHFDNSPENVNNPDSTIPMGWGGPTTMEMMIGYIQYADAEPHDWTLESARQHLRGDFGVSEDTD